MTFLQILKNSSLKPKETEILFTFLLNKNREYLLTHPEILISAQIYQKFKKLEKKRLAGWSIAVLIGKKEFYGLNFTVNKNVLIPRPETEIIVNEVLSLKENNISQNSEKKQVIIDLGTGSGAIIVAIANSLKNQNPDQFKKTTFWGIDISSAALKIAAKNIKLNKLTKKIKLYRSNLLSEKILQNDFKKILRSNMIICANLPYLSPQQIKNSPSILKEPRLALDGGKNGLKYYQQLFKQLKFFNFFENNKNTTKTSLNILCEIDPGQKKEIKILCKKYLPDSQIEIKNDLSGQARLVIIH